MSYETTTIESSKPASEVAWHVLTTMLGPIRAREHRDWVAKGGTAAYRQAEMPRGWSLYRIPHDALNLPWTTWPCDKCGGLTTAGYSHGELKIVKDKAFGGYRLVPENGKFEFVCFGCSYGMKRVTG